MSALLGLSDRRLAPAFYFPPMWGNSAIDMMFGDSLLVLEPPHIGLMVSVAALYRKNMCLFCLPGNRVLIIIPFS